MVIKRQRSIKIKIIFNGYQIKVKNHLKSRVVNKNKRQRRYRVFFFFFFIVYLNIFIW